jgi:hypothetical protein
MSREKIMPGVRRSDYSLAEESLTVCRQNLQKKILEYENSLLKLQNDIKIARSNKNLTLTKEKLKEKTRLTMKIEKTRNALSVIDKQLDTLETNMLDQTIMTSLKKSNTIMKKAGLQVNVDELEHILHDVDENIHQSTEITNALQTPLNANEMFSIEEEEDFEEELEKELHTQISTPYKLPGSAVITADILPITTPATTTPATTTTTTTTTTPATTTLATPSLVPSSL